MPILRRVNLHPEHPYPIARPEVDLIDITDASITIGRDDYCDLVSYCHLLSVGEKDLSSDFVRRFRS